jgi:hypothetical protein
LLGIGYSKWLTVQLIIIDVNLKTMRPQHFESSTAPYAQEEWTSATRTFFGTLQHQALPNDSVTQNTVTSIDKYELDTLNIFRMQAGPHVVTRLKPTDEACAINNCKLILQLHGSAEIRTDTERHELRCGDWGIYDPQKRYSITNFEDMDILVAQIPRTSLGGRSQIAVPISKLYNTTY